METIQKKVFVGELLSGKIETNSQLEQWYDNTGIRPPKDYMVLAVGSESPEDQTILACFYNEIQAMFPEQLSFIKGKILYVLRYQVEEHSMNEVQRTERFQNLLKQFHCYCGASSYYQELLDTVDYVNQARDTLHLARILNISKRICFYREYALASIIYPRLKELQGQNYIHPAIRILMAYDRKHHTEFLRTLKSYIENLGNSGKILKELHIHRNSLSYRLAKIEELTGYQLDDFDTFLHLSLNFYGMRITNVKK